MATLRVTSLRGRTSGTSPTLPDGAVVTGVTTSTSAIVGSAVTINSTGIDAGAGIITATSFVGSGEGLTGVASTDNIITGTAATFNNNVNISGITTVGVLTAYTSIKVGTAITMDATSGIVTATSFSGDGSSLSNLPAGAPVGGASTNTVFFENDTAVAVNYQITSGKNAMSAGPIAINAGIAVTVPSGSSWTIV